ncbi:acetyl-CoA carboxylase biotin carboxyl carrier protein [Streptosporangiaceae bacterium NEAU-GS5]|nr:acetyl-CoA carboxylase biotin carboxyl carrier protein [Streptosporangiaceae bacterium NEAU-GS5]
MSEVEEHPEQHEEKLLDSLVRQARDLSKAMPGALSRVTVTAGDHQVEVEWQAPVTVAAVAGAVPATAFSPATAVTAAVPAFEPEAPIGHAVVAPLVGTFYRAAEPGATPYVNEGDVVEAGQELAIVEAMKIMNRVEADRAGRIVKILPSDGEMVEYGQELMYIEPVSSDTE